VYKRVLIVFFISIFIFIFLSEKIVMDYYKNKLFLNLSNEVSAKFYDLENKVNSYFDFIDEIKKRFYYQLHGKIGDNVLNLFYDILDEYKNIIFIGVYSENKEVEFGIKNTDIIEHLKKNKIKGTVFSKPYFYKEKLYIAFISDIEGEKYFSGILKLEGLKGYLVKKDVRYNFIVYIEGFPVFRVAPEYKYFLKKQDTKFEGRDYFVFPEEIRDSPDIKVVMLYDKKYFSTDVWFLRKIIYVSSFAGFIFFFIGVLFILKFIDKEINFFEREMDKILKEDFSISDRKSLFLFNLYNKLKYLKEKFKGLYIKNFENKRLKEFGKHIGIIGHELRRPLAGIMNSFFYIKNKIGKERDEKLEKHIKIVSEELKRARRFLEDLLSYLRERKPVLRKINLPDLLKEIKEDIDFNIELKIDKKEFFIEADSNEIKQVLKNIIYNSIEAGANKIEIILKKIDGRAKIEIKDDGCGIKQEDIEKIFNPFFSKKEGGTGLGLAVCKKIIEERHGGKLKIESIESEGTKVIIELKKESERSEIGEK